MYTYKVNGRECCEVVVGTKSGKLGVITTNKRFVIIREKAHSKTINCIQLAKGEMFITTA
jgi:hypothetical protein